ncbi:MAG: hypothetical protein OXE83_06760, partial [Gammaproteobacteria bacterium]|nr:hypothetical protein [Gammaproteobacteria bacterium]
MLRDQLCGVLDDFQRIPGFDYARDWSKVEMDYSGNCHERPRSLRDGEHGVYAFFQSHKWLRIGQTSHSPRFTSQHYGTNRARSNFARDIWKNRAEFGYKGEEQNIGDWILKTFGRANIILPSHWPSSVSPFLEAYM